MANHKSAIKQHRKSLHKASRNRSVKNRVKTFIKKVDATLLAGQCDAATHAFDQAQSEIMKGVTKGVMKLNTASRRVQLLHKRLKSGLLGHTAN